MGQIDTIKEPVSEELKRFNRYFSDSMKSDVPLLNMVTRYLLKRKGKQIRPLLIFLSAGVIDTPNQATHTAAALAELLHTATLIHDDVVDESHQRRGFLSINAIWKSKIAVLAGDYLLSKGLITAVENKAYDILEIFTDAVRQMSEGELYQIQKSRKLNITEEEYYTIIQKKTASLLAACTASGARSVTTDRKLVNKMLQLGLNVGMAFQIKDDLFDYEKTTLTGKPKGNDIKEKKLTLPLIISLSKASVKERKIILKAINRKNHRNATYKMVYEFVHKHQGMDYSRNKMKFHHDEALRILNEFNDSSFRKSFEQLIRYIIERDI